MKEKIIYLKEEELHDYEHRQIAQRLRQKTYKTALRCKEGHKSKRVTRTQQCYECFDAFMKTYQTYRQGYAGTLPKPTIKEILKERCNRARAQNR